MQDFKGLNQALVQSVLSGNDEVLRLVGGTIIHEMRNNAEQTRHFWPSKYAAAFSNFPGKSGRQSQWATDYTAFIDQLESQKLLTQEFSTFAYAVFIDGTVYNTETGLSIMVSVADEMTIMVPSTETETAKYIDIPIHHILKMELEATVLTLHLLESAMEAYYINESSRLPCRIHIAFDERHDAQLTKDTIETIARQRTAMNSPKLDQEPTSCPGSITGQILSQSAVLNVSSGLREQRPSKYHDVLRSQDKHSAPRAQLSSTQPDEMVLTDKVGSPGASRSGRPSRLSKSGVLRSTEMLNVSQKEQQQPIVGREDNIEAADFTDATKSHDTGNLQITSSVKAGRTNEALLDDTQPHGVKRKIGELPRITPNKKAKITHTYTGNVYPATRSNPGIDDFDVPASPPKPKEVKMTSHKSSGTFKVSKDGAKVKGRKSLPKTIDNKVKITKMKQQAKAAGPQKPALRPRTTRAAAKIAKKRISGWDESDDEEGGALIDPEETDSPTNKTVRDREDSHNNEESHLAFLPDAPEFDNDPVHQQAVGSNFEDAMAMMNPEEGVGNHNGQPLDNDLGGRSVPKEGRFVVFVSGKGGNDGDTPNTLEELDLRSGQSLPTHQENSVREAAYVGEVALAEEHQQTQELEELLPKGQQPKKPKTPSELTETLSEALSGAFQAYQPVPKGSNEAPALVDTATQQPMGEAATMNTGVVAQRSEPNLMDLVPQANGNIAKAHTIKLEPDSPLRDMPNSDWVTVTSDPSGGPEGTDGSSHRQSMTKTVHQQQTLHKRQELEPNFRSDPMSMPHTAGSSTSPRKMRSADVVHENASKIETGGKKESATKTSNVKAENHKDPRRIPNVIGFSAEGPRNQGLLSPFEPVSNRGARGLSQVFKRKRDVESTFAEASEHVPAQTHEQPRVKKARIGLYDGPIEQKPAAAPAKQAKSPSTGVLLEHSSLFAENMGPRMSSQSSRVNDNGSPQPNKHFLNAAFPRDGEGGLSRGGSDGMRHKQEGRFFRSSNSKHQPSSPNAPSAILTGVQAEDARSFDILENGQTRDPFEPSGIQDPFIGGQDARRTRFLDKLRQIHSGQIKLVDRNPKETLVEKTERLKRRKSLKGVALTYGESSETSSSQEPTQSARSSQGGESAEEKGQEAAQKKWRDGLGPQHNDMLDVLHGVSRDLVSTLIDAEKEVENVANTFERRGNRMLARVAEDLKTELQQYSHDIKVRQKSTIDKMRVYKSRLAASRKHQPVAVTLSKELLKKRHAAEEAAMKAAGCIIR
ncbi:MAG: hypothetical protein Q9228_006456 [Teloschistes exilis]